MTERVAVVLLKDWDFLETDGPWPGWPMKKRAYRARAGDSVDVTPEEAERMIRESIAEAK